ncbi:hypothetical protein FGIG_08118 [Fasciola gigantica]|uniref:Uncharacterized protein n=1 Tax=Fasciola gigantica TaxID=46835 RepID=A0A504YK69_FASGI|nr:hypothetical protein FGIG_08118 [Fasciola gigantica]
MGLSGSCVAPETTDDNQKPPTLCSHDVSKSFVISVGAESEEVNVTVTGYPVPAVQCEDVRLDDGIQVAAESQGGVMLYRLQVPSIQQIHLHRYTCWAENPFGVATLPMEFTVAPSDPVVLSPSQTKYSD